MIPVLSDVEIYGSLKINKNVTLNGTLEVGSNTTLNGTLEVGSNTTLNGTLKVIRDVTVSNISCTTLNVGSHINNTIYFNNDKTINIKNNLKINYKIVERTIDSSYFNFSVDYSGKLYNASFWNKETGKKIDVIESTRNNTFYGTIIDYITTTPYVMKGIIAYITEDKTKTIIDIKDSLYLGNLNEIKYYGNNVDDVNLMKTLRGEYIVWLVPKAPNNPNPNPQKIGKINFDNEEWYESCFIYTGILGQVYFIDLHSSSDFNTDINFRMYCLNDTGFNDQAEIYTLDNLYFTRSIIQEY